MWMNKAKRHKIECLVCRRTFDSDYRTCHNEKYHRKMIAGNETVPYKILVSQLNSFSYFNKETSANSAPDLKGASDSHPVGSSSHDYQSRYEADVIIICLSWPQW